MESLIHHNRLQWSNMTLAILALAVITFILVIFMFGPEGLILCAISSLGFVLVPYLYNKPKVFLFGALFAFPFTRLFSLNEKFIITGILYSLSFPCAMWLINKNFIKVSKGNFYIFSMVLYCGIILMNVLRPEIALIPIAKEFGRMFFGLFIVLAIYDYVQNNEKNLRKLCYGLSYVINISALVGILQFVLKKGSIYVEGFYRARGLFFNFNEYGYIISIFICFALYFLLNSSEKKEKIYWSFSILLNCIALLVSLSKTSLLTTGLVFLVMAMFIQPKKRMQLFGSMFLIGISVSVFLMFSGYFDVLVQRFTDKTSLVWRLEMWRTIWTMIQQGNMFIGQGLESSRNFLQLLLPEGELTAPHNVYLETFYNLGVIALVPFVMIFLGLLKKGITIYKDKADKTFKLLGTVIIVVTVVTMIQNFVSNAFYDRVVNIFFWATLTIFFCLYENNKNKIVE